MARFDYTTCRECHGHVGEVGTLSHTRLCAACGVKIENENAIAMHTMQGPRVLHWRRRMAASVGAVLLDDTRASA